MAGPPEYIRIKARFRAVPPVLADTQSTELRVDASGALVVVGGGGGGIVIVQPSVPLSFDTGGVLAASGVIRATPGTLLDVNGFNQPGAVRFFQLFDSAVVPADGAVPVTVPIRIPANTEFSIEFAASMGRSFSTGIVWASSSTQLTKTITAALMLVNAQHRNP